MKNDCENPLIDIYPDGLPFELSRLDRTPAQASEYAVVDVETANPARRSICQIGLVLMCGTEEVSAASWFVDPKGPLTLTWIHGITEDMLRGAPSFPDLYPTLIETIGGRPIVSHSEFDPQAFRACTSHYDLPEIVGPWIDSMDMLIHIHDRPRPQSYALDDICEAYGIPLKHHDALSDARAAARITAMAIEATHAPLSDLSRITV